MKTVTFTYRGDIEIGSPNKGYRWVPGYSETSLNGNITYPWQDKRTCQREAKAMKRKAVFIENH